MTTLSDHGILLCGTRSLKNDLCCIDRTFGVVIPNLSEQTKSILEDTLIDY